MNRSRGGICEPCRTPDEARVIEEAKGGFIGSRRERRPLGFHGKGAIDPQVDLPEKLRPEIDAARQRAEKRPAQPGVRAYPVGRDGWQLNSPHRDLDAWEVQICDAFGTRSYAAMWAFLDQLVAICTTYFRWDDEPDAEGERTGRWMPNEVELNAVLALIHAERPETPLQAALLAQMAACHILTMQAAADGRNNGGWVVSDRVATFAKLARTSAMLTDAYRKLRGGKQRNRTVRHVTEKHVHMHYDRHVHMHPPQGGGGEVFEGQAQEISHDDSYRNPNSYGSRPSSSASAIPHVVSPTMPGENPTGNIVPMRSGEGEGAMPRPRGREGVGGSQGGAQRQPPFPRDEQR